MKMRKYICLFFALMLFAVNTYAQKKEIITAEDRIKSGKDLEKSENELKKFLTDSANMSNKKLWFTLFNVVRKQYEQGNEKLYLKENYDTVKLFQKNLEMFDLAISLDSVDALPNKKGKVKISYRENNAEILNHYRPNLFYGGLFYIRKQNYADGYKFMDAYLNCGNQPLFSKYNYLEKDPNMPTAAYWTVYCGYKMHDTEKTLHHASFALKDSMHYKYMLQYFAETYKAEGETTKYLETLTEGFKKYPSFPFFFPRLMQYYGEIGQNEKALDIVNNALKNDSTNELFLFAKSTALLNLGRFEDCINICENLLAHNDSIADIYLNIGSAYFNRAVKLDKITRLTKKQKNQVIKDYTMARKYMEKYRALAPEQKEKWAFPLYTIYLNLNLGKEFDEIDKIIR